MEIFLCADDQPLHFVVSFAFEIIRINGIARGADQTFTGMLRQSDGMSPSPEAQPTRYPKRNKIVPN
ncbi:MAG: hypothetical protein K9K88_06115 [Desulfobacterales bacterium]|nr:hypothetical protein [Desulfobacterales bacterium]